MISTVIPPSNSPPQNNSGIAIALGLGMGPPGPLPAPGFQRFPFIPPITISKSIPIEQPVTSKRQFQADFDQVNIIFSNNLHREIENRYRGTIENKGINIFIFHENENTAAQMQIELEELMKKYSFDDDARWAYLENDGRYQFYDQDINCIIESRYREVYYQLSQDNYQDYSLSIDLYLGGASYILEFAHIGGVHRQKRKYVQKVTIRDVKRQAAGEDLNKQYVRSYNWLWESRSGEFKEYEPDTVFIIEISWQEYLKNKDNSIIIVQGSNGYSYQINLETQVQVSSNNFMRRIKRVTI
jgi:hypothetical protein